jgi:hypothetical protein
LERFKRKEENSGKLFLLDIEMLMVDGFLFFHFISFLSIFDFTKVVNFCWEKTQFTPKNDLLIFPCNIAKTISNKKLNQILCLTTHPNNNNSNKLIFLDIWVGTHLDK